MLLVLALNLVPQVEQSVYFVLNFLLSLVYKVFNLVPILVHLHLALAVKSLHFVGVVSPPLGKHMLPLNLSTLSVFFFHL